MLYQVFHSSNRIVPRVGTIIDEFKELENKFQLRIFSWTPRSLKRGSTCNDVANGMLDG